ncbi:MAG: class I SAM-dependent methyltransferase [Eubacterium sp.]|nr:class I SAM-dependent methyltransferase [Eubacterium sp.]
MWVADKWKDYEVLDCSAGEKLERWGKYTLLRPDPQVIWITEKKRPEWKNLNGHYHRSKSGGGEWEFHDLPKEWTVQYELGAKSTDAQLATVFQNTREHVILSEQSESKDLSTYTLTFHLKPFAFKHTGLFPEQAVNWEWFYSLIRKAVRDGRKVRVLNLFAYTGGATLAAAAAGAEVTHVDASKGMVTWAKENAVSSGLGNAPIRWLVDDCVKFVERELRRGKTYDAIIMDPPSYGRGPRGELWKIEESVFPLLQLCSQLLSEKPLFFLINSYTTGLQPAVLSYMLNTAVVGPWLERVNGIVTNQGKKDRTFPQVVADEIGLHVEETGLVLPCGASGRAKL